MQFTNIDELRQNGFEGFIPVSTLQVSCSEIPNVPGIYLVLKTDDTPPQFLEEGTGGWFKGKNPNCSLSRLQEKWVENTVVLYIGKAGTLKGRATLRSRLKQYMQFGQKVRIGHWGGRLIWQLGESDRLKVCWKPTPNASPRAAESELIKEFRRQYDNLPFANLSL